MKNLTALLIGAGLAGNLFFNSCKYEKSQTEQIEKQKTSPEDTLLKTAGNFYLQGEYDLAKENYSKFLEIKKTKNDSLGIAKGFQGLGLISKVQGNYDEAVKYRLDALKIYENLKDSFRIAQISNDLGMIFDKQNKNKEALEYYNKSLEIKKALNDSLGISQTLNNLAIIFEKQNNNEKALKYYFNSLEIAHKIKNKKQEANCYNNIAVLYDKKEELDRAFEYYQKSLIINKEIENKNSLAFNLKNIGDIYRKKENYFQALKNLNSSLEIAQEINAPDLLKDIYQTFSETYEAKGDISMAFKYFKRYSLTKDFLLNSESLKQVAELETKYQSEKKEQENKLLRKDNEIQETKNEKQKWGLWGLAGILGLSGALAYSFYKGRKIIKEKNENITASIRYASLIQKAILPENEKIKRLLPESFIFYKPKDIVSGDFYWLNEKDNKVFFSASDCTGHGVPGAFMHMTLNTLLNEAVNQKNILKPNEIFNDVRKNIISSLKSTSEIGERKDGMDSILCAWDKSQNTLEFACANNPLYLIRNNELIEFKGDRMPVGYSDNLDSFTLKNVELEKNDLIYLSSDGYQDQFGGPQGKKFMRKNLKELLLEINKKPMQEQKEILEDKIKNWKGALDQCDDLLVIGVKFCGRE